MITWTEGNLFACGIPDIAHGVNCKGVMGAGIARQFRDLYPQMYEAYRKKCGAGGFWPGDILPWRHDDGRVIFNLATQENPGPCAQPWMIAAAVGRMIQLAHYSSYHIPRIAMPLIGCGIGGLTPDRLQAAIQVYQHAPVDLVIVTLPAREPSLFQVLAQEGAAYRPGGEP